MGRQRFTPVQIIAKLREVEVDDAASVRSYTSVPIGDRPTARS